MDGIGSVRPESGWMAVVNDTGHGQKKRLLKIAFLWFYPFLALKGYLTDGVNAWKTMLNQPVKLKKIWSIGHLEICECCGSMLFSKEEKEIIEMQKYKTWSHIRANIHGCTIVCKFSIILYCLLWRRDAKTKIVETSSSLFSPIQFPKLICKYLKNHDSGGWDFCLYCDCNCVTWLRCKSALRQ